MFLHPKRILYLQYTNPAGYPPLLHSSKILAEKGWEILFLGIQAFGNKLTLETHPQIQIHQLGFCPAGIRQKFHYLEFCLWSVFQALRWKPQWIYASDPLAALPALLLIRLFSVKVIYHEHDSPDTAGPKSFFMRLALWARRTLARKASLCILPNEARKERFEREVFKGEKVLCVWNCPLREEVKEFKPSFNGHLNVLYQGSIVPDRLPFSVLEAFSLLPETARLKIIGYETVGSQGYVQALKEKAVQLGINQRVDFIGTLPRRRLFDQIRKASVGLSLMPTQTFDFNEQNMTGASNKAFDYLACGLPLLVPDLADWRAMYVEQKMALSCDPDNAASIAGGLRWFLEHPFERQEMGERGRRKILADWHYEKAFSPVLQALQ